MRTPAAITMSILLASSATAGPPRYAITELEPHDADGSSWGWAIHDDGRVAGARIRGRTQTVGTVWSAGPTVDYAPFLGADHAWAFAVGADDAAFGASRAVQLFANPLVAWVSTPDLAPSLLSYIPQYSFNATMDANRENRVTGWTQTGAFVGQEPVRRAFIVLVDGALRPPVLIPTLGGWANWGNAINDGRTVVGGSLTAAGPIHAFRWTSGPAQDLGTLGGPASEAIDINTAGRIVGWAMNGAGERRAFIHDQGVMTDLGTLGGANAEARGINDAGTIVGESWTADGGLRAFVIHHSRMLDLQSRTINAAGWTLLRAEDINESGVIVGWGTRLVDGRRFTRGFRLDPLCSADIDGDGQVGFPDYLAFLGLYDASDPRADLNTDGVIDFPDYLEFLNYYDAGC